MKRMALLVAVLAVAAASVALASSPAKTHVKPMPFTFYMTHYVLLGDDPNNPTGVRYESTGKPTAKAKDGSIIALSGQGGWDPAAARVSGGGRYRITDPAGAVTKKGTWRATRFVSFKQLPGWWGIPGFREEGWQGPPGSSSFSGFLTLRVRLDGLGAGVLKAWCLMPEVPKPPGHVGDGISLTGPRFRFTDFKEQEMSLEGLMFYAASVP